MHVLILANGDPPSTRLAQRLARAHDLIMATDGAAHQAAALGLRLDIICGDFDSIRMPDARSAFPDAEFIATPDQEQADLEKAIGLARTRGATTITLLGATGGRIDHTLAAFALLLRYHAEVVLALEDDRSVVRAVSGALEQPGELTLTAKIGDTISLISFDGAARVTLVGTRWPLRDELLPVGTRGVSNRAERERVVVRARGGAVLVCHLREDEASPGSETAPLVP